MRYLFHTSSSTSRALLLFAVALLLAPWSASAGTTVLSTDGELASLEELGQDLRLNIGTTSLFVPGTAGGGVDRPLHLLDAANGHLAAVWLAHDGEVWELRTATYDGTAWDGPYTLEAGGEPVHFQLPPRTAAGEDRSTVDLENGTSIDIERQMVHVVWQTPDGRVRYSPLVFQDGAYLGWNEIVTLSTAFAASHSGAVSLGGGGARLLDVATAGDRSVVVALEDGDSQRFGALRVEAVPLAVEVLGDAVHQHLIDNVELYDPENTGVIAEKIRGHIIHIGAMLKFDPAVGGFFGSTVESWMVENGGDFGWDLIGLADATRGTALDVGRSVYTVTVPDASGDGEIVQIDIRDFLDDNGHRDELERLVRLRIASDFAAPENLAEGAQAHVSSDGASMAFSWIDGSTLRWVENRGDGWSEARSLTLSAALDASAARDLVERSLR